MPDPKMRRPAYFGCVAGAPRSTPIWISSSSRTRSTAVSSAAVETSSSELRKAWFWIVTCPTLPARSTRIGPRSTLPEALEVLEERERLRLRLRHRVHEVEAHAGIGQHVRDEDALVDLEAAFVLLRQLPLGVDLGPCRE